MGGAYPASTLKWQIPVTGLTKNSLILLGLPVRLIKVRATKWRSLARGPSN